MKYTILILVFAVLLVACKEEPTTEEAKNDVEVNESEVTDTQESETSVEPTNVVTPEFWENFNTDVQIVFYYSKVESSPANVTDFKEQLLNGSEANGYNFHEYHTDENMGMVQVDDNVFFNLTEYLWNNDEGFVLLKKGALQHIPASELSESTFEDQVVPFFQ